MKNVNKETLVCMLDVYIDHYVLLVQRTLKDKKLTAVEREYLFECKRDAVKDKKFLSILRASLREATQENEKEVQT